MDVQHEILEFNPNIGAILIKYVCNEFLDGLVYNIDLPLENGTYPSQEEITALIKKHEPTEQLKRLIAVKTATIPTYLAEKIVPVVPIVENPVVENPVA
jgi:hypothetical protein